MADESVATLEELAGLDFPAMLSGKEIEELEGIAQRWAQQRRLGLCVLGKSKAELVEAMTGNDALADAFLDMAEASKDYRAHLATLIEQAECAQSRILVAVSSLEEARQ